jgi:molybdopterin synthase sulfur carrier subunit
MQITLKFFATFREVVGSKTVDREVADGTTVGEVLTGVEDEYPGLEGELLAEGTLNPQINVLKNGREVRYMDGIDTPVDDGDTVSVFPPVAGGVGGRERRVERSVRDVLQCLDTFSLTNLDGEAIDSLVEGCARRAVRTGG